MLGIKYGEVTWGSQRRQGKAHFWVNSITGDRRQPSRLDPSPSERGAEVGGMGSDVRCVHNRREAPRQGYQEAQGLRIQGIAGERRVLLCRAGAGTELQARSEDEVWASSLAN